MQIGRKLVFGRAEWRPPQTPGMPTSASLPCRAFRKGSTVLKYNTFPIPVQQGPQRGCSPILGLEWAGTRPAPTVVTGEDFAARRGWTTGGTDSTPATRRQRGMVYGGRCGGNPPAQGRAEGPTAQLQSSVISGAWSEGTAVALLGDANWL